MPICSSSWNRCKSIISYFLANLENASSSTSDNVGSQLMSMWSLKILILEDNDFFASRMINYYYTRRFGISSVIYVYTYFKSSVIKRGFFSDISPRAGGT